MHGTTYLDPLETSSLHEVAKFVSRPKLRSSPSWITEPAAKTTMHSPQAPGPKFSDHKPSAGPQYAGHFYNYALGVTNEAKHSHGNHTVKGSIVKRQIFGLTPDELHLTRLAVDALLRSGDHLRVRIETHDDCTTPGKFPRKCSVAATDIQDPLTGKRPDQLEEELLLQPICNLAKTARSPPCVQHSQPLCRLRAAHRGLSYLSGKYIS
jgi:hypothetical protein